ncbi:hypothetical protein A4S06_01410 [Erysipelotrichaceae bacterium MTC7]|nr:hypothetical protein A4S06_01410 [Erysipelotrichaceae bacterium MTC7]
MHQTKHKLVIGSIVLAFALSLVMPVSSNTPVLYKNAVDVVEAKVDIYPKVQKQTYISEEGMKMESTVNVVVDELDNEAAMNRLVNILNEKQVVFEISDTVKDNVANIIVSNKGVDSKYLSYVHESEALSKEQGYVLDSSNDVNEHGNIAIVANDKEGAFYGIESLEQMLDQVNEVGYIAEISIDDFPSIVSRGYVEGFYGFPWTFEQRAQMLQDVGQLKMNTYIYAPKDDPYHKDNWKTLYPEKEAEEIRQLAAIAAENNVSFTWSIHPGTGFDYADDTDYNAIITKFEQLYSLGVRQFGISYDDLEGSVKGEDHANIINRVNDEWVKTKGDVKPLIVVATRYCNGWGPSPTTYLKPFLQALENSDVIVMWTGNNTMSPIKKEYFEVPKQQAGTTRDLAAWWNYPVNDYSDANLNMAPLEVVDTDVDNLAGFYVNPMPQAEASKVAIFSCADYSWNVEQFDYMSSWKTAIQKITPDATEAFERFADNTSYLNVGVVFDESRYLVEKINEFNKALESGEYLAENAAIMKAEFDTMLQDVETIRNMENTGMIKDIENHLKAYELTAQAGLLSMNALEAALSKDINATLDAVQLTRDKLNEANKVTITSLEPTGEKQTVVRVGEKRVKPMITSILDQADSILYGQFYQVKNPYAFGDIENIDDAAVIDSEGKLALTGVTEVNEGNSVGIAFGELTTVFNVQVTSSQCSDLKLEYSINGIDWDDVNTTVNGNVMTGIIPDAFVSVRIKATKNIVLDDFHITTLQEVTKGSVMTSMPSYEDNVIKNSFDNDLDTRFYSSSGSKKGDAFYLTLDQATNVYDASIIFGGNPKGIAEGIDGFAETKLSYSVDGRTWTEVGIVNMSDYKESRFGGTVLCSADFNLKGANVRHLKFEATKSHSNWVQVYEFDVNVGSKQSLDLVTTDITSGNSANLYDHSFSSLYAPTTVVAGDTLTYKLTTITNVSDILILQDRDVMSNAKVEIQLTNGQWEELGILDEQMTTLHANTKATNVRLTFTDVQPKIAEIMVCERTEDTDNFQALRQLVKEANTIDASLYTPISAANFTDARTAAKEGIASGVNEATAKTLHQDLEQAMAKLILNPNKDLLGSLVAIANEITDEDIENVIPVVKEEFIEARTEANDLFENTESSQSEVDASFARLSQAMQKLEFVKGDKTNLEKLITSVSGLNEKEYRPSTWKDFSKALKEAKVVLHDENAMQEEVNASYETLMKAFANLRLIPDKSMLEGLLEQADAFKANDYTKESFAVLKDAKKEAKKIINDKDASQEQVTASEANLTNAIKQLEPTSLPSIAPGDDSNGGVNSGDHTSVGGLLALAGIAAVAGTLTCANKKRRMQK